jgi:hypothetical protein
MGPRFELDFTEQLPPRGIGNDNGEQWFFPFRLFAFSPFRSYEV